MNLDEMTPDEMRSQFWGLKVERDAKLAISTPLREQRDELTRAHEAEIGALQDQIRAAEDGLVEIDNTRAALARALGGQTGEG